MPTQSKNQPLPKRFNGASSDPAVEARLSSILDRLYGFHNKEIDLSLDRTYRFMERLGNPHLRLPKVVHVADTNGKGSTIAALRALLEQSGHAVHVYTSPHLVHPTERIRLAGEPITSEALITLLTECIDINNDEPITFFELFTCASFLAFSRVQADYLLLETGMGGRLDTTNIVPNPVATIITAISYDHTGFLGNTLKQIAFEKAGIMKAGVPCVIGYQFPQALGEGVMEVFQQYSRTLSPEAPLLRYGSEWCSGPEAGRMLFRYEADSILTPKPNLPGNHQLWNAGAALAAFRVIAPEHFRLDIISTAFGNIEWPGRLQTLENHEFNKLLPPDWTITIDGGHNDTGGQVLAQQMQEWRNEGSRPIHLVVAMVNRKDPRAFLKTLLPYAASLTVTGIESELSSFKPEELAQIGRALGFKNIYEAANVRDAILRISELYITTGPSRLIMAGSLYFMGNILSKSDIYEK